MSSLLISKMVLFIGHACRKTYQKFLLFSRGVNVKITPGSWSIGLDDLLILEKEVRRYEQKLTINVLEIGSGFSTIAIISILKKHFTDFVLTSVEADKSWANKVQQWIGEVDEIKHGQFMLLNLDYDKQSKIFKASDIQLKLDGHVDLIFVDAPPDTLGENVRLHMCLELLPLLGAKSTLVLHDTNRTDERFAYSHLANMFRISELHETTKGIAVFRYPSGIQIE